MIKGDLKIALHVFPVCVQFLLTSSVNTSYMSIWLVPRKVSQFTQFYARLIISIDLLYSILWAFNFHVENHKIL